MSEQRVQDISFVIFVVAVLVMTFIYFSQPERPAFFEYQYKWWGELIDILKGSN